jgi:hypothetical protein
VTVPPHVAAAHQRFGPVASAGFTRAAAAIRRRLVFIAGEVAEDRDGRLVGKW